MPLDLDKYNDAVKAWGAAGRASLIGLGRGLGIRHRAGSTSPGESLAKIRTRYKLNTGAIEKVSFSNINHSLIYTTKGAGKGRGGLKGSRWIDKHGQAKQTNPSSFGKMGSDGRRAKPFIDNMLDGPAGLESLGDIAAVHLGDAIIDTILEK